jgi:hypothetical protein
MAETAQPAIAGEYPPLHGGKLFFLTVAIATASFMEILDMTIVNVSVPSIAALPIACRCWLERVWCKASFQAQ